MWLHVYSKLGGGTMSFQIQTGTGTRPPCTGRAATIYHQDAGSYFHVEAEPKDIPASSDDWQVRRETSLPHGRYKWKQGSRRERERDSN